MNQAGEISRIVKPCFKELIHAYVSLGRRMVGIIVVALFAVTVYVIVCTDYILNISTWGIFLSVYLGGTFILAALFPTIYFVFAFLRKWEIQPTGIMIRNLITKNRFIPFSKIRGTGGMMVFAGLSVQKSLFRPTMKFVSDNDRALLSRAWAKSRCIDHFQGSKLDKEHLNEHY